MNKQDLFKNWISDNNLIKTAKIRDNLFKAIDSIPDYFFKIPASSTGKYHPAYSLGEGGLFRHVVAATWICKDLVELQMYELTQYEKDYCVSAIILHDAVKKGIPEEQFTRFDHPFLASRLIKQCCDEEFCKNVCPLVESHMGQWNTDPKHCPNIMLPTPDTKLQQIVHLSDYLASRKYIAIRAE